MPSGARKRKSAKKKIEMETHNGNSSTNNNPQGSNEELEERGAPPVRPIVSEDKGVPSDVENDGVVKIEREVKEDSASKNVVLEDTKSAKGSDNGDDSSSSSSSSSSDDESRIVEKRQKEDAFASVSEEKPHRDLVRPVESSQPELIQTTEDALAGNTTTSVTESTESPVIANVVVKTGLENGGEKSLSTGIPVTLTDPESKKVDERASLLPNETAKSSSSVGESASEGKGSEVFPSLATSQAQVSNDAESIKGPEVPEYSEEQPLVAPAPPVVQKTSWFSCCGILDVITGSNR